MTNTVNVPRCHRQAQGAVVLSHNPLDAARDEGFAAGIASTHSETLRDHFAMAALTGLLTRPSEVGMSRETYADVAYRYADAMMEARK